MGEGVDMGDEVMECSHKEPMLFGFPEYEVKNLADTITRANEAKETNPGLYDAAMKLLKKRQTSLAAIIGAARKKG